jgi:hypothetical protein
MAADTFYFRRNGLFYDVINERSGEVVVELVDCVAEAKNYIAELTAAAVEAEAIERAEYLAQEREKDLIYRHVAALYDADKPATDPRNFAVSEVLGAIDSLGRPDADMARAA